MSREPVPQRESSDTTAQGAPPSGRPPAQPLRLVDLIDLETLQAIQDGFAKLARMATSIRDEQGRLVTHPSGSTRFCELVGGPLHDNEACQLSNYAAASAAAAAGSDAPTKYVCHAGLVQFAATIRLEDRVLGTIVLGDLPERRLTREEIGQLARKYNVNEEELAAAAADLQPRPEAEMRAAISFLRLLANTLTRLCYQQALLQERVEELTVLSETSRLLSSTLDPDTVLDNIVRTMAEVLQVKACSLRLLNETGNELVIKAAHGLSSLYLRKGPVLVAENVKDQAALRGEIIQIADMRTDPLVRYREEARREGLVSSLAVGLIAKGKPLGTLHIYTGEPHTFGPEEIRLFRSVADQAAFTVRNAHLVEEVVQARQQKRELEVAAAVQKRLLPARAPAIAGYDCYGITVPSLVVGGDLHDWIELPEGNWGIAVGDVAGKGVPAALLMASLRSALRAQAEHVYKLDHIMDRVNRSLAADTAPTEFATLFYGVLDSRARRLTYSNAGHEPPLLIRPGSAGPRLRLEASPPGPDGKGQIRPLTVGGPLLGVSFAATYESQAIALEAGDTLVAFSDGAFDAANFKQEQFGKERLLDSIRRHAAYGAQRMVEEIQWDIRRWTGLAPRVDDLTLVVIKVL